MVAGQPISPVDGGEQARSQSKFDFSSPGSEDHESIAEDPEESELWEDESTGTSDDNYLSSQGEVEKGEWDFDSDVDEGSFSSDEDPQSWGAWTAKHEREATTKRNTSPKLLSWVSPLPDYDTIPEANRIAVQSETFIFLSAFLFESRVVNLPFPKRHGLARFLLSCTESAFYKWTKKWHPKHLELLGIREADELELSWWIELTEELSRAHQVTFPPEAYIHSHFWCGKSVEQIRHIAAHRERYNTRTIRSVVDLMIATDDVQLIRDVEHVLQILYALESQDPKYPLSDGDQIVLDKALGFTPTVPKTPQQLMGRLAYILERVCFDYAVGKPSSPRPEGSLEPHGMELHRWRSRPFFNRYGGEFGHEFDDSCVSVRHIVEHKCHFYTDLQWVKDLLRASKEFATLLDDEDPVTEIDQLEKEALLGLEVQCGQTMTAIYNLSEASLRDLERQAKTCSDRWANDYQLVKFDYQQKIQGRYQEAWKFFKQAADGKKDARLAEKVSTVIATWELDFIQEVIEVVESMGDSHVDATL